MKELVRTVDDYIKLTSKNVKHRDINYLVKGTKLYELLGKDSIMDYKENVSVDIWIYRDYLFGIYNRINTVDNLKVIKKYLLDYSNFYKEGLLSREVSLLYKLPEEMKPIDLAIVALYIHQQYK